MTVPADLLRASLDDALEVVALTDTRAKELVADVLSDILALREHGVEEAVIDRLIAALRQCCSYNDELAAAGRRLSRRLDDLARTAHHAQGVSSVKALAAELRPHLAMVATPAAKPAAYRQAVHAIHDIIEATPFDRLVGGGLSKALGPGRHALLMSFVRGQAEPQLTQHVTRSEFAPAAGSAGGEAIGTPSPGVDGLANPFEVAA